MKSFLLISAPRGIDHGVRNPGFRQSRLPEPLQADRHRGQDRLPRSAGRFNAEQYVEAVADLVVQADRHAVVVVEAGMGSP